MLFLKIFRTEIGKIDDHRDNESFPKLTRKQRGLHQVGKLLPASILTRGIAIDSADVLLYKVNLPPPLYCMPLQLCKNKYL